MASLPTTSTPTSIEKPATSSSPVISYSVKRCLPVAHSAPAVLSDKTRASVATSDSLSELPPWHYQPYKETPPSPSFDSGVRFLPKYDTPIDEVLLAIKRRQMIIIRKACFPPGYYLKVSLI
ncbi:uncharacterized protein [Watersipora subatra]|uniref:uncharacterized protein n=1 Tax=Watersipora subatra TaxID=2589382 RepID=UPI00355BDE51